jgi:hypothetical protein
MNAQLKLLGVLLRKDLRLFWPFAALTAAFTALWQVPALVEQLGVVGSLVQIAIPLATILLILVVFHEDAVVSVKHDWLTRPIPRFAMLAAKIVFVSLVILLPAALGSIANGFFVGRPAAEVFISGLADGLGGERLMIMLLVMSFAALTSGIRQAVVMFLAGVAGLGVFSLIMVRTSAVAGGDDISASVWIISRTLMLLIAFAALAVLGLQYRRQRGHAAWVLIGVVALAGTALVSSMSWPRLFALQKRLSPEPAAESLVALSVLPGCFPARKLQAENPAVARDEIPALFPEEQRELAGPDAIAFAVRLVVDRLPEGGRLALGRAQLNYRTAAGENVSLGAGRIAAQWTTTPSGQLTTARYWLVSKRDYQRLAADSSVTAHIDYSISLMQARASAAFTADGRRSFHPGIGYCGANFDRAIGKVGIDCYRLGDQPAVLVAKLAGQADSEGRASSGPDFTPAALDFWGGKRHGIQLRADVAAAPEVQVTVYEGRAHFERSFDVPGVLGGPASACPAP